MIPDEVIEQIEMVLHRMRIYPQKGFIWIVVPEGSLSQEYAVMVKPHTVIGIDHYQVTMTHTFKPEQLLWFKIHEIKIGNSFWGYKNVRVGIDSTMMYGVIEE